MHSAILNVTFDCMIRRYWLASPPDKSWPRLVFVAVPEPKVLKNRVHLELLPVERDQSDEVERLWGSARESLTTGVTSSQAAGSCWPIPKETSSASSRLDWLYGVCVVLR
jgi:hypothetical protein